MKLAFFLLWVSGGSMPIYGKNNRLVGRTQRLKLFGKQGLRLPDNAVEREKLTEHIYLSSTMVNLPTPVIAIEDENGELFRLDLDSVNVKTKVQAEAQDNEQDAHASPRVGDQTQEAPRLQPWRDLRSYFETGGKIEERTRGGDAPQEWRASEAPVWDDKDMEFRPLRPAPEPQKPTSPTPSSKAKAKPDKKAKAVKRRPHLWQIAKDIAAILRDNGKMTPVQIADFLAEDESSVTAALASNTVIFVQKGKHFDLVA